MYATYCHICGQENKVHKESAWHLVTHFFNDITHFDGKFFSSLKYLISRPGFLSKEYSHGRRADYLNPVRMYVFTSAIFFLIFFSLFSIDKTDITTSATSQWELRMAHDINQIDSVEFKQMIKRLVMKDSAFSKRTYYQHVKTQPIRKKNAIYLSVDGKESESLSRLEKVEHRWIYSHIFKWELPDSLLLPMDENTFRNFIAKKAVNDPEITKTTLAKYLETRDDGITLGDNYKTRREYDSLREAGVKKDNWIKRQLIYRTLSLNERYKNNSQEIITSILQKFTHSIPQMLFVSLPILAFILKLLYIRRKNFYYVEHAIFTVHLFIFIFLMLLLIFGINKLSDMWAWDGTLSVILVLLIFFYLYKAMRNFYQQRRAKTVLKYMLFLLMTFFVIGIIFTIFFFFSLYQA